MNTMSEIPRQPLAPTSINSILNPFPPTGYQKPVVSLINPSKRKADEIEDVESDNEDIIITKNCDQVRRQIRTFIGTGEMKVGDFQKAIGVNSKGYSMFMNQSGRDKGIGSNTYFEAYRFFKKREQKGIKAPKKKTKKAEEDAKNDVSSIQLEGEADLGVPVYDSCDEIRKKIRAYLGEPNVTQAGFLREIAKTYKDGRKIQSKVLNDFLGKRGATAGNTSAVYYSSYVFFEKMRIRDGKPKSKHRQDMEKTYGGEGVDTKHRREFVTCHVGERPYEDKLGQIHIAGRF